MRFGPAWERLVHATKQAGRSRAVGAVRATAATAAFLGAPQAVLHAPPETPQERIAKANVEGYGQLRERAPKGVQAVPGRTPPKANRRARRDANRHGHGRSKRPSGRTRRQEAKARNKRKIAGVSRRANRPHRRRGRTGEPVRNARVKRQANRTRANRAQAPMRRPATQVAGKTPPRPSRRTPAALPRGR
jgi:hypothetical protein